MANEDGEREGLEALASFTADAAVAATQAVAWDADAPDISVLRSVIPEDYTEQITNLEQYAMAPRRKRGSIAVDRADSFIAYLNRHEDEATTRVIYARDGVFVGVMNDHAADAPGWGDHRVTFRLRSTPAWDAWTAANNTEQTQQEFAEFLEDRLGDIAEPAGATLMEIATTLRVKSSLNFQSQVRMSNGQVQLTYNEEIDGRAGVNGDLPIPEYLTLSISPFEGVEPMKLTARFRWRIRDGKAKFHYTLGDVIVEVVEAALTEAATKIEKATSLTVLYGAPAAPLTAL